MRKKKLTEQGFDTFAFFAGLRPGVVFGISRSCWSFSLFARLMATSSSSFAWTGSCIELTSRLSSKSGPVPGAGEDLRAIVFCAELSLVLVLRAEFK